MTRFKREVVDSIKKDFFSGKILIVTGARQVGKTTLVNHLLHKRVDVLRLSGDDPADRAQLEGKSLSALQELVGDRRIVFIDEAQKVANIGETLKLLVDHYGKLVQIIATGSSSINLLTNTQEALTGRKYVYALFGISVRELLVDEEKLSLERRLPTLLVYGSYPAILTAASTERPRLLQEITTSYLFQDVLQLEQIRNPAVLDTLIKAIALQLGSVVSLPELSSLTKMDVKTVERYIDLMEKSYLLFRVPPYFTNQRKTLSKKYKIYFYDLGVRNALINNFNPLELRSDVGALWENFVIVERLKLRTYRRLYAQQYFWRTYSGAEIDLVEDREGQLYGYECKWRDASVKPPASWIAQPNVQYTVIRPSNVASFLFYDII